MMDRHELAADWLQRLDHPDVSEDEIQSWLEWFGASDQNRKAFEEVQTLRRRFRSLPDEFRRELPPPLTPSPPSAGERVGVRGSFFSLALAASIAALALALWWKIESHPSQIVYTAPATQHRTVSLEDGSALVLAADSSVAVAYSSERRSLNVQRGEAYFEVRANPRRPFVVEAGGVRVTALGTAFNVLRDLNKVTVTVTEGLVEIAGPPSVSVKRVAVGQRTVVPLATASSAMAVSQPAADSLWKNGRADFVNAPLSKVLAEINPYVPAKLVIDDPRVDDLTYSGTILREHIDEWVASLPRVYAIRAVPLEDGTLTLVSRRE